MSAGAGPLFPRFLFAADPRQPALQGKCLFIAVVGSAWVQSQEVGVGAAFLPHKTRGPWFRVHPLAQIYELCALHQGAPVWCEAKTKQKLA